MRVRKGVKEVGKKRRKEEINYGRREFIKETMILNEARQ